MIFWQTVEEETKGVLSSGGGGGLGLAGLVWGVPPASTSDWHLLRGG